MTTYISKIGVSLVALALVVAPALVPVSVSAQTTPIVVSIANPINGADVTVNQSVAFNANGVGGTAATYTYAWELGDGTLVGVKSFNHTYTTTGSKTVKVRITDGRGNTGVAEITVDVVAATTDSKPVISNVLVASKTQTTATITWTTDIDATSRVIYGLTSQKDPVTGKEIGSAPNYNYTNSQPASVNSSSPKTKTHSVTLTGLTPGTKYYFRVLSAK